METSDFTSALPDIMKNMNYFRNFTALYLRSRVKGKQISMTADDVIQETFVKLLNHTRCWIPNCNFKTQFTNHLKSVAYHELCSKYRIKERNLKPVERYDDPVSGIDKKNLLEIIVAELFRWAECNENKDIKIVLQKSLEGYRAGEIAEQLGESLPHIKYLKKHIFNKIIELRDLLNSEP